MTYMLLLSLPQMATLAPSVKMHCLGNLLAELNSRKVDGMLSGRRYMSKFLVVRLSTSSVVSSGDKAALPLGELASSIEGVWRQLTLLLPRSWSRLHLNFVIHSNTYDGISKRVLSNRHSCAHLSRFKGQCQKKLLCTSKEEDCMKNIVPGIDDPHGLQDHYTQNEININISITQSLLHLSTSNSLT